MVLKKMSNEQNPEVCDARDDDSSTKAGYIITLHPTHN